MRKTHNPEAQPFRAIKRRRDEKITMIRHNCAVAITNIKTKKKKKKKRRTTEEPPFNRQQKQLTVVVLVCVKRVREKSRKCHNQKPQPFPDTKRKRKQSKPNKRKSNKVNKRMRNTETSSLFPKRGIAMLKELKNTRTK